MNCGGTDLHLVLDLGDQPNGNNFLRAEEIDSEVTFPLKMIVCRNCWQVQIDQCPQQELLFGDHPYLSGVNQPVVDHFDRLATHICKKFDLQAGQLVLDIGCNDGTLLSAFRKNGTNTLGIDPGKRVTDIAKQNGHVVCRRFFNLSNAQALADVGLKPDLITATAVFYHAPDLHDFLDGIEALLEGDSVFVVQAVSLKDLVEGLQFDHFYHEHSCIHSVTALQNLLKPHRLRLLDVEHWPIHGGSFVAYIGREDHGMATAESVARAQADEQAAGLSSLARYETFARDVAGNMDALKSLLVKLKSESKSVYGLGAPLKGSTLLNYAGIGPDLVSCLTEVNAFKIGRLAPGVHIPVVDERTIGDQPDYYLVLSWNFIDHFIEKYAGYLAAGGKFIVPVPELRVIGSEDLAR